MTAPAGDPLPAIVYSPAGDYVAAAARCMDHCRNRGYEFVGIVRSWAAAQRMLDERLVAVAVVDQHHDLPADRVPRVEVVAEYVPPAPPSTDVRRIPRNERMARTRRIIRRTEAGEPGRDHQQ